MKILIFMSLLLSFAKSQNSNLINKPQRALVKYNSLYIDSSLTKQYNQGENLVLHCPIELLNTYLKSKHSQLITNWYKNQIKLTIFNIEDLTSPFKIEKPGRVKLLDRKLKIKDLTVFDSGIYMCEMITGTGISIKSHNLTLIINENDNPDFKSEIATDYEEIKESAKIKTDDFIDWSNIQNNIDFDRYVRGEAPMFQDDLVEREFNQLEKSNVEFDCTSRGTPSPETLWYKNGQIISEEEFGLIRNVMVLRLKDINLSDSANYTCQVSNQFGNLNRTFTLKVLENLKFIGSEPNNKTVNIDQMLILKCMVETNSALSTEVTQISWYFRSENLDKLADDMYLVSNESSVFQLNGETFYQIDLRQQRKTYQESKFYFNKVKRSDSLKISSQIRNQMPRNNIHQLRDGSLIIERANLRHSGQYLCFAKNSRGFNYRKAFIKIHDYQVEETIPRKDGPEFLENIFGNPRELFKNFNSIQPNNSQSNIPYISTPIIFIVTISLVSIVIIIFLIYFYKNI